MVFGPALRRTLCCEVSPQACAAASVQQMPIATTQGVLSPLSSLLVFTVHAPVAGNDRPPGLLVVWPFTTTSSGRSPPARP